MKMRNRGDSQIDERLIQDALTEHIDRVDATRDLWPGIRDRLNQRRQARFPLFARVAAATAVVSLLALLGIVRPWSLFDDSMTPFAAVAHAYDGLFELETVRYRIDGTNSSGQVFEQLHQVDMINRIEYSVSHIDMSWVPGPIAGGITRQEFIQVNGKLYVRHGATTVQDFGPEAQVSESFDPGWGLFPDAMTHPEDGYPWAPFGKFGGLPWSRENAEDRFDKVELVGDTVVDGQPAIHYRASRSSAPKDENDLHTIVYYVFGKRVENVHRGVEDYLTTIDTVDIWVTPEGDRFIKADWMHIERGPPLPEDYKERDWCEGLGEFNEPEYTFRVTDSQGNRSYYTGAPGMSRETHDLAEVVCWNAEETEGRKVWGRSIPEHTGEDFWVRWVYTFTAFNEPLDLPDDMPE